jgi:ubiquinone/menaquinone biosynthesis C-methylase UbiE
MATDERVKREKEYHNKRFTEEVREATKKYYKIAQKSNQLFKEKIFKNAEKLKILEIGCAKGNFTKEIAKHANSVVGIDISEVAIEQAIVNSKENGVNNTTFLVMDGANITFPDNSFDRVVGGAILHHLEYETAIKNISRILKPSGNAIFLEPLGHNPFINLYRKMTPKYRSVDEQPLRISELKLFQKYFATVEIKYFYFFTLLAVPFHNSKFFSKIVNFFDSIDRVIFSVKYLRKYAWQIVIELRDPIR